MAMPFKRTLAPRVMKFLVLVDYSLVIINIYFVCLIYALGTEDFYRNNAFSQNDIWPHPTCSQELLPRGS